MLLAGAACPTAAQNATVTAMPRGAYPIYADEEGSPFASYGPELANTGSGRSASSIFRLAPLADTARMVANAECIQGIVRGHLTHATGADGGLI